MTDQQHPNAERAREYLEAYGSGDLDAIGSFLADDIVWRVGGSHRLSGTYHGKDEVLDYLRKVQDETGSMSLEPESVLASDKRLAMFLNVRGERENKTLDAGMAQVITIADDGRWSEFWALSDDQPAIDEFWG
jgi:ketosteroid isomerase-like protein